MNRSEKFQDVLRVMKLLVFDVEERLELLDATLEAWQDLGIDACPEKHQIQPGLLASDVVAGMNTLVVMIRLCASYHMLSAHREDFDPHSWSAFWRMTYELEKVFTTIKEGRANWLKLTGQEDNVVPLGEMTADNWHELLFSKNKGKGKDNPNG